MKSDFFQTIIEVTGLAVLAAGLILLLSVLYTIPVFYMWNWLMPILFGLPQITALQAFGLLLLCNSLFKSSVPTKSDIKSAIKEAMKG